MRIWRVWLWRNGRRAHGKPAVVSGVGLEPLDAEDAEWVADIASHITAFSCRDMPSLDAIDSSHSYATLAPDDCFVNGLEGVYLPDEAAGDLPETMVCVQTDLVPDPAALLDHMGSRCSRHGKRRQGSAWALWNAFRTTRWMHCV